MRIKFSVPVFFVAVAIFVCCQRADSDTADRNGKPPGIADHVSGTPASLAHFIVAEQQLAEGRYVFAATHLNKGIVAFRIETGKMVGSQALSANRAIDTLTRLRKTLRHGEPVTADDLHRAILTAMESEAMFPVSTLPKPDPELIVPVNGN